MAERAFQHCVYGSHISVPASQSERGISVSTETFCLLSRQLVATKIFVKRCRTCGANNLVHLVHGCTHLQVPEPGSENGTLRAQQSTAYNGTQVLGCSTHCFSSICTSHGICTRVSLGKSWRSHCKANLTSRAHTSLDSVAGAVSFIS